MLGFAILFSLYIFFFWVSYKNQRHRRDLVYIILLVSLLMIWLTYFYTKDTNSLNNEKLLFLSLIVGFIMIFFILRKILAPAPLYIVATQQSYWNISPSRIISFFAPRKEPKTKRIDININELQQIWFRKYSNNEGYINANFFLNYENLRLTTIKDLQELALYPLYKTIFDKLSKVIFDKEISVEYKALLETNNFIAEYFLMELWEKYTKDINIGVASLIVIANREIEKELIGALDNLDLNSIKRNGAGLYYSYIKYKNKLPQADNKELKTDSKYEDF